jgi:hypothetical protein
VKPFYIHEHVRWITHEKKQVLLVDFSMCSAARVQLIARAVPDYVTVQPRGSLLLLADFRGASFDDEANRVLKESYVFDKPYVKKLAWVGTENLPHEFEQSLKDFARREHLSFKTHREALDWLVKD